MCQNKVQESCWTPTVHCPSSWKKKNPNPKQCFIIQAMPRSPQLWVYPISAEGPYTTHSHQTSAENCSWIAREGSGLHLLYVAHCCFLGINTPAPWGCNNLGRCNRLSPDGTLIEDLIPLKYKPVTRAYSSHLGEIRSDLHSFILDMHIAKGLFCGPQCFA